MRISDYTFNKYLKQKYIDGFEGSFECFNDKDITFLTFDKWKIFYEADQDNWKFHHDTYNFMSQANIYYPYYLYIKDGGNKYRLIKFPNKREYKKFYKFYRKNIAHDLNGVENQQEILDLAQIIGQKASIKVEEAQKSLQENYKDYYKILKRCAEDSTHIQNSNTYIYNKTPYSVFIPNGTKTYYYENNMFKQYLISGLVGRHIVEEERFYDKYIYCRIKDTNDWVKLANVEDIIKIK